MEADKRFASDCLFWGLKYGGQKNNSRVNLLCFQNKNPHAGREKTETNIQSAWMSEDVENVGMILYTHVFY
ncbi:hypothetical protein KZ770_08725 [Escherichia coli]|nr:hypothetical protein [Escherichia coli]